MIEFGGSNIGWPRHGIYRASTGKLTTPGGDIDLPGRDPNGGDCYLIQIPGLPTPSTSTEEAADGQTWVNHALIYDGNLYGKDIGGGFIYIDSENRPWRIFVTRGGTRAQKEIRVTISTQRFGFVGTGTAPTVTLAQMTVAFDTHADYPSSFGGNTSPAQLIDVSKNGNKCLVAVPRYRGYAAVAEVTLSGSPADGTFSSNMSLLSDESMVDSWPAVSFWETTGNIFLADYWSFDWTAAPTPDTSGNLPTARGVYSAITGASMAFDGASGYATHTTRETRVLTAAPDLVGGVDDGYRSWSFQSPSEFLWQAKWLAGARYDSTWAAVVVSSEVENSISYEIDFPGAEPERIQIGATYNPPLRFETADQTIKSTVFFGADSSEYTQRVLTTVEQTGVGAFAVDSKLYRNGSEVKSVVTSKTSPWSSGSHGRLRTQYDEVFSGSITVGAIRRSNSVYVASGRMVELGPETGLAAGVTRYSTTLAFGNATGRIGSAASSGTYASEHPITGAIAHGNSAVCWV